MQGERASGPAPEPVGGPQAVRAAVPQVWEEPGGVGAERPRAQAEPAWQPAGPEPAAWAAEGEPRAGPQVVRAAAPRVSVEPQGAGAERPRAQAAEPAPQAAARAQAGLPQQALKPARAYRRSRRTYSPPETICGTSGR